MTVNTTNITSGPYTGNGVTTEFSYTFRVETKDQLAVYETDDNGVQTLLAVDTDYTVSGLGDDTGGTITRTAGALPSDYTWYIRSNYDQTQTTDLDSQGGFFPDVHEAALDKLTFLIQQHDDKINRCLRIDDSDINGLIDFLPPYESGAVIRWNLGGTGFENYQLSSGGSVADAYEINYDGEVLSDYLDRKEVADYTEARAVNTGTGGAALGSKLWVEGYAYPWELKTGDKSSDDNGRYLVSTDNPTTRYWESASPSYRVEITGAEGDGVTDDYTAIEDSNLTTGNTVGFKNGTYSIGSSLELSRFSSISSDDRQSFSKTVLQWDGATASTCVTTESNQTIEGVVIDANSVSGVDALKVGNDAKFLAYINIDRVWTRNADKGITVSNAFDTRFTQVRSSDNRIGISLDPVSFGDGGYLTTVKFSRVYVTDNTEEGLIDNAPVKNKMLCIGDNSVFENNGDAAHPQILLKEGQVNSISEVYIESPSDLAQGILLPNGYLQNAYINGFRTAGVNLGSNVSVTVLENIKFASGGQFTGTHTGSNNAATLTDSSASWETNELIGLTINNTTDVSSGEITANTATTVTATLSDGTDNNWDSSDAYTIDAASVKSNGGANARYCLMRNCEFSGAPALDSVIQVYEGCGGDMPGGIPEYSHVITGSVPKFGVGTTPAITRNIEAHLYSDAGTTVNANTQYRFNVNLSVGRITDGFSALSVTPQSQLPSGLMASVERNSDTTARVAISNITNGNIVLPATDYLVRVEQFYQIN